MYAEVVVLTYQAPDINSFTYEIPKDLEEIKVGQLVEVPFGKRNPMGIVVNILRVRPLGGSDPVRIKTISKILLNQPLILPYQIELAKWMANYYIAPLINCVEIMLPPISSKSLIINGSWKENKTTNHQLSTMNQSLVLVPSINRIAETLAKFPKAKNHVVYHGELKPAEKFAAWNKIISGSADYIFGSRSAIFAPCPKLKEIIIYDEHENGYKSERSPYFDTLTVAEKISKLTGAELKIVDPAPKITTYSILKNHIKMQKFNSICQIISMKTEKLSGNRSSISYPLEEQIIENYEAKNNILLFLNRKKESGYLFCKNCKTSQFLDAQPKDCPICKSTDFFFNTLNINSLATSVKKIIPNANVNLISDKSKISSSSKQTLDIATSSIFYWPLPKKYSLIAYIQTDSLLKLPDFSACETLYYQITNLKKMLKENGKLILQSANEEDNFLDSAADDNFEKYYQSQLLERKSLNYPPFGLLVKLTLKGKNIEKIKKEASSVYSNLLSTINHDLSTTNQLTILGPYQSIYRGTKYNIILKYKLKNYSLNSRENAISEIRKLTSNLKNWQITTEPESIN